MIVRGPGGNPARCEARTGKVEPLELLRGGAVIRLPVSVVFPEDKRGKHGPSTGMIWLDFEVTDRDALFQLAEDIKKALAEPMGGA